MRISGPANRHSFERNLRTLAGRLSVVATAATLAAVIAPLPTAAADPAAALPEELSAAITRDLGYSADEYLQRAEKAQELSEFVNDYRARNPDSYAGAWLDENGEPVVAVTNESAISDVSASGYRAQRGVVSANAMDDAIRQLVDWISALPRDVAKTINGIAVDALDQSIVVEVANSPVGQILNLPTLIANVRIVPVPAAPDRTPAAIGGDSYITSADPIDSPDPIEITFCSLGFAGNFPNGGDAYLSAGHCDPLLDTGQSGAPVYLPSPADPTRNAGPQIGSIVSSRVGGPDGVEYSVIAVSEAGAAAGLDLPEVRGGNGSRIPVTGVADAVVGAPICKSGKSSSYTCGVVTADRIEVPLYLDDGTVRTIRGFAGSTCSLAGDSGGAIISGTRALGITSGSNSGDSSSCGEAALSLATSGGTSTVGIPINDITAATGIRLKTVPAATN